MYALKETALKTDLSDPHETGSQGAILLNVVENMNSKVAPKCGFDMLERCSSQRASRSLAGG